MSRNNKTISAVEYLDRGFSVIPLQGREGLSRCSCGRMDCPKPGKHPIFSWKKYQSQKATENEIREWWTKWPFANIGIVCGEISGRIAVLDIDDHNLAEKFLTSGIGKETLTACTPRGGIHIYLVEMDALSSSVPLVPGIADLKAQGGYVVAPPSNGYEWISEVNILQIPNARIWAMERLKAYDIEVPKSAKPDYELLKQGTLSVGTRDNVLTSFAGFLWEEGFPLEVIYGALEGVNKKCASEPLSSAEVEKIVKSISRYLRTSTTPHSFKGDGIVEGEYPPLELVTLAEVDESEEINYIVQRIVPEGYISFLYGDGGRGKSFLAMAIAISVATGMPFLHFATKRKNVLYIDWELDKREQSSRARRVAHGFNLEQPPQNLFYIQAEWPLPPRLVELQKLVANHEIGLVIVDSFGAGCGGDSESANFTIEFLQSLRILKQSILIIDHQSKLQHGQDYRNKTLFGSAYKFYVARSVIHVNPSKEKEKDALCLLLEHTKSSFGPLIEPLGLKLLFQQAKPQKVYFEEIDLQADPSFLRSLNSAERILSNLKKDGPATAQQLSDRTGIGRGTVTNCLGKLKKKKQVREAGKKGSIPFYQAESGE